MKIVISVEADDGLVERIVDMVERIVAAEPIRSLPKPEPRRLEDVPPATGLLSPTPHRFRRSNNGHGHA
jgi:hypothetical protein